MDDFTEEDLLRELDQRESWPSTEDYDEEDLTIVGDTPKILFHRKRTRQKR